MPQRIYPLIERISARILSLWVKPQVLPEAPQSLIDVSQPVLYVLEFGGIADRTALSLMCRKHALPMPSGKLRYGKLVESSSVEKLQKRQGFVFRQHHHAHSARLERVVKEGLSDDAGDILIVPVAIYWGRAPGKPSSFWGLFYSENWQVAGRTRKLLTTLLHGRHTLLQFSEPLSFKTLKATTPERASDTPTADVAELLTRKLGRILRVHFRERRNASLGPDQSHRRLLINTILGEPRVRQAIADTATAEKRSVERQQTQANKYALEIAADISYPTIRVLHRLLIRLWNELYDGVQLDGIDRLREVADGREIVYVPCHRSHIDYLLMSYILYVQGFSLPHVAAGVNLNLPVVGGILRRGGAFFLRRSFSGNPLYATVFNAYLKAILQRGHSIEYFIEGGRSRSGRLLPPKGGMLAMTVHAYLQKPRTPVMFVPIYFGYERLLEGRSFTSELAGGKKRSESVFGLLKSLHTLRQDYGRVHVNFGDPIALETLLDSHRESWRTETITGERPTWMKPIINELGDTIMRRINEAASVTPISLLATALLATRAGVAGLDELERQIQIYHHLLRVTHEDSLVIVPKDINPGDVIEHGHKLGFVSTLNDKVGPLVRVNPGQSAPLTYFRNNIQHLLAVPALIAAAFTNRPKRSDEALKGLIDLTLPALQSELFLSTENSEALVAKSLAALQGQKLLHRIDDGWRRAPAGTSEAVSLIRLAEVVMPSLERGYLTASLIARAAEGRISRSKLAARCQSSAERLAYTHERDAADLYDKHLLGIFIDTMQRRGFIQIEDDELIATSALQAMEDHARSLLGESIRHAILSAATTCSAVEPAST